MAVFDAGRKAQMYQFFAVAFGAAPGTTYWGQLQAAVESGMSTLDIVKAFTSKAQFLSTYPLSLSTQGFANLLIENVIKSSASASAKALAASQVVEALEAGLSRGEVIYKVFGNLAARETDPSKPGYNAADPFVGVAQQLAKQVQVAQYYTEVLKADSPSLNTLQSVLSTVTDQTDVSSVAKLQALVGPMLFDAGRKAEMYQFFAVAFGAAPGTTYWGQLQAAVESGMSTLDIVKVFTSKTQFLSTYPLSLSAQGFANLLIENVIKSSASASAKALAASQVVEALDAGLSRGEVIYNVFGNLAARETDLSKPGYNSADPFVGVAQQLAKQVQVAQYYTEVLKADSASLATLQRVIGKVSNTTDVSSVSKLQAIVDDALATISGVVIDGYVSGATVYADLDSDGIQDPDEPSTVTDANGNYTLNANGSSKIVAFGGTDLMTGKAFEGVLTAPAGSTTVSPITTLVQAAIESGKTLEAATTQVKAALGLPASVTNIVTYDPIAVLTANQNDATALAMQKAAQQVASVITQTTTAIDAADPTKSKKEVAHEVIKALSAFLSANTAGTPVDLSSAATLTTIVTNAATATGTTSIVTNAASVAQVTASSNAQIQNAATLVDLNKAAVVAQVDAVQTLQTAATNNTLGNAATEFTNTVEQLVQEAETGNLTTEVPVETLPAPANVAPVGVADTLAASEDTAVTYTAAQLLGNDTDANGDALSIKSVTAGTGAIVLLNANGTVTFTPSANFNGAASFSYVATDGKGGDSAATTVTVNVAAVNDAPTGSVTIAGNALVGQTLTAANTLADADGPATLSVSYQWQAGGSAITGATASTYVLQAADVGKPITVVARYTDSQGSAESVTSAATAAVVAAPFVDTEATGTLTITGTAAEGATISADISGITDTDGAITSAYQWQENIGGTWTKLSGKTAAALAIADDQSYVGKSIRVVATTTDAKGGTTEFTSAAQTVSNVNDLPTGAVTITGTATEGQTLTANTSALADADGPATLSVSYQWQSGGQNIASATASTYVLQAADVGKSITVVARYTDGQGSAESVTSAATAAVVAAPFVDTEATGTLTIAGTVQEGANLTANLAAIDTDGAITSAYQWQENIGGTWTNLSGKTAAALAIADDQSYVGKSIRVVATTTDAKGGTTEFTSAAQTVSNVNDLPTGAVTITGTATAGQTLTAANTLADADGPASLSVSYQWQANGSAISGATASTYVLQAADVGKPITVVARYTDGQGTAESVASAATAAVDEPTVTTQLDSTPGAAGSPITYNASAAQTTFQDDANVSSYAVINGFGANDTIALTSNAQDLLAVSSQSSNVTLTVNNNGTVSSIVLQNVLGSGQVVYDLASFNALPVGNITFNGKEQPQGNNLDSLGGTLSAPATVDAGNGSFAFTDNASTASVVRITGFGANDSLLLQNATASQVAVSSKGTDVTLVVNKSGTVTSVTLVNIVVSGAIVYDIDSFNALPVGDVTFL